MNTWNTSDHLPPAAEDVLVFAKQRGSECGDFAIAQYVPARTMIVDWDYFDEDRSEENADYDEETDEFYWPPGWYFVNHADGELNSHLGLTDYEVTHWMPLRNPKDTSSNITVAEAINVVVDALSDDDYRLGWESNIAMAYIDACPGESILAVERATATKAAKAFVDLLIMGKNAPEKGNDI